MKDYGNESTMVYCHNCGYSRPLYLFLKENYPSELANLKDVFMKSIGDGSAFKRKVEKAQKIIKPFNEIDAKLRMYAKTHAFNILEAQTNENREKFRLKTIEYFKDRRITNKFINDLFCFYKGPLKGYAGIPFYDDSGDNLIHIQGRRIFKVKDEIQESLNPKYKFIRDVENGIEIDNKPLWGTCFVDKSRDVLIVEGTLDADAFYNATATCGATMSESLIDDIKKKFPKRIWCPDNYWIDKSGKALTQRLLMSGERCFIFPRDGDFKDGNQMIVDMGIDKVPIDFVYNNIYEGKLGLTKLKLMEATKSSDIIDAAKGDDNERQMENSRSNRKGVPKADS